MTETLSMMIKSYFRLIWQLFTAFLLWSDTLHRFTASVAPEILTGMDPGPLQPLRPSPAAYLQTDRHIHPAAEGGADGSWWEAQVLEDLWEGLGECYAWPLLCYHHARTHARQVHISQLKVDKRGKKCKLCENILQLKESFQKKETRWVRWNVEQVSIFNKKRFLGIF